MPCVRGPASAVACGAGGLCGESNATAILACRPLLHCLSCEQARVAVNTQAAQRIIKHLHRRCQRSHLCVYVCLCWCAFVLRMCVFACVTD